LHIDQHTKALQKSYCKTVLAEHGQLTKDLFDKINAGDEKAMRQVYTDQQQRIRQQAERISRPCKFPPTRMGTGFSLVPAGVQSPENRQIRI